ncbi:hypothetical protein [Cupriavidus sp. WS]|uniref:hypothetical protein n=1 Tax=Cupriavidus sp. WS TaxID=1312922 RepID=UPI00037D58CB|nr:hypothetical protein [Cupriavidus sp. WS]
MRFLRTERYEPLTFSARKQAAFARKQQRERNRYPLFTEHIAEEQHSPEEEFERRRRQSEMYEQRLRDFTAGVWRRARALYFAQPEAIRAAIQSKWQSWTGPASAVNFSYWVDELSGERARRCAQADERTTAIRRQVRASMGCQPELEVTP